MSVDNKETIILKRIKSLLVQYEWDSYYLRSNKKDPVSMPLDMMFFLYFLIIKPNHIYRSDMYDRLWSHVTITDILSQLHFLKESTKGCHLTRLGKQYVHYAFPVLFKTYIQEPEVRSQVASQKRRRALAKQEHQLHDVEHQLDTLKHPKHFFWYKADIIGLLVTGILMVVLFMNHDIFPSAISLVGFMSLLAGYIMNKIMTHVINQPDIDANKRNIAKLRYKIHEIENQKLTVSHFGRTANYIARDNIELHSNHTSSNVDAILDLDIKQLAIKYDDYISDLDDTDRERFKRFVIQHQDDKSLNKSSFIYFMIKQNVYKQANNKFGRYQTLIDRSLYADKQNPSAMMLFCKYIIDHGMDL